MKAYGPRQAYRAIAKTVTFRLDAPKAREVLLVIRLAKENVPSTRAMSQTVDGAWSLRTELPRGRYVYRFMVDGTPVPDPTALGSITDEHGGQWSTREIGY
ncbi:MAG TPA: hypothetical protein VMP11_00820 [Verrucomicrobiae bacterium]|nr:hypothetical protein [Verrucomicrobiae bacterium]